VLMVERVEDCLNKDEHISQRQHYNTCRYFQLMFCSPAQNQNWMKYLGQFAPLSLEVGKGAGE
jgi:hypothetical protein